MKTAKAKGDSLEAAIHILEAAILKSNPLYSDKTFRVQGKKVISVAGVHHELDIWVSVELGYGYDSIFVFECKNWQKKVTKNDLIVFSAKIKVAKAQKGFFVAKTFTRDAQAQAETDPRIQLLRVREVDFTELPTWLQYFHLLEQTGCHTECSVKLKTAQETGEVRSLDLSASKLVLDGQAQDLTTYVTEWQKDTVSRTTNKFRSEKLPEMAYTLPFEDLRVFKDGICLVNDEPVASMKLTGSVEVHVRRAEMESRFEVERRGRVYRTVVEMTSGRVILCAHELITGLPGNTA
jgi:Restriction endonuclease